MGWAGRAGWWALLIGSPVEGRASPCRGDCPQATSASDRRQLLQGLRAKYSRRLDPVKDPRAVYFMPLTRTSLSFNVAIGSSHTYVDPLAPAVRRGWASMSGGLMDASERLKSRLREPLRLGLWLDFRPAPGTRSSGSLYGENLELASLAESMGFSAVFTTEHHGSTDDYLPAPLMCLAAIAARTERVLLGSGMALSPLWPIRLLAEEFSVLDLISDGRAVAGLGLGYADFDFQAMRTDRHLRARILDSQIAELHSAWGRSEPLSDGRPLTPARYRPAGCP